MQLWIMYYDTLNITQKEGPFVFDFEKPKIEIAEISEDKKYGRFVVEPLERGYGTTLGNSLKKNYAFLFTRRCCKSN